MASSNCVSFGTRPHEHCARSEESSLFDARSSPHAVLQQSYKALARVTYSNLAYFTLLQAYIRAVEPAHPAHNYPQAAIVRVHEELKKRELKIQEDIIALMPLIGCASPAPQENPPRKIDLLGASDLRKSSRPCPRRSTPNTLWVSSKPIKSFWTGSGRVALPSASTIKMYGNEAGLMQRNAGFPLGTTGPGEAILSNFVSILSPYRRRSSLSTKVRNLSGVL